MMTRLREQVERQIRNAIRTHGIADSREFEVVRQQSQHARRNLDDLIQALHTLREMTGRLSNAVPTSDSRVSLTDAVRHARQRFEGQTGISITRRVDQHMQTVVDLTSQTADLSERIDHDAQSLEELQSRIGQLQQRLKTVRDDITQLTSGPTPSQKSKISTASCTVPGCDRAHRARGFCGLHYSRWRKGTLEGFVCKDGTVRIDGQVFQLDIEHTGKPVRIENGQPMIRALSPQTSN